MDEWVFPISGTGDSLTLLWQRLFVSGGSESLLGLRRTVVPGGASEEALCTTPVQGQGVWLKTQKMRRRL